MAQAHPNPDPISNVRLYVAGVAKSLVERLYGPDGPAWGTSLSSLENTITAVREALAEQMLQQALTRQSLVYSSTPTTPPGCPGCQGATLPRPPEPRFVTTSVGEAQWLEPHLYCPNCRKAFFPSVQEPRP